MNNELKEILLEIENQIHDLLTLVEQQYEDFNDLGKKMNSNLIIITQEIAKMRGDDEHELAHFAIKLDAYNKMSDAMAKDSKKTFKKRFKFILENYERIKSLS